MNTPASFVFVNLGGFSASLHRTDGWDDEICKKGVVVLGMVRDITRDPQTLRARDWNGKPKVALGEIWVLGELQGLVMFGIGIEV